MKSLTEKPDYNAEIEEHFHQALKRFKQTQTW
jgi:hypothetical protein